ncbi:hypothetical protein MHY87_00740 [Microvirga sp. ACRRW]|uniref:hypothetical protein n=1 Tax=Microvirga sp. ACRRW TaxID=2918205 RepID=UPI001EF5CB03|nr:hypothetical protein [Microvirga sp. ACRRW]MCG7391433.1 hypothetical protein [Microvirga sp. ACRRW]
MAGFLLHVIGSAGVASLVITGLMAYEGSLQLAGLSKQRYRRFHSRRDFGPPDA